MSFLGELIDAPPVALSVGRWIGKRKGICRPSVGKVVALSEMFETERPVSSDEWSDWRSFLRCPFETGASSSSCLILFRSFGSIGSVESELRNEPSISHAIDVVVKETI